MASRWNRAIDHQGEDAKQFVETHFGEQDRRILLVAGAGFDPRATLVASALAKAAAGRLEALFIREQRPSPRAHLVERAERNVEALRTIVPRSSVVEVEVFASDRAVT